MTKITDLRNKFTGAYNGAEIRKFSVILLYLTGILYEVATPCTILILALTAIYFEHIFLNCVIVTLEQVRLFFPEFMIYRWIQSKCTYIFRIALEVKKHPWSKSKILISNQPGLTDFV